MGALIDITDETYNRLTVLYRDTTKIQGESKRAYWVCECACGNICSVSSNQLRTGTTKSCGCLKKETARENGGYLGGIVQEYSVEYHTWCDIKNRCYNTNNEDYSYYGERGIEVCGRWLNSFPNFLKDMGQRPIDKRSIDRTDNDGNYEPNNCKWATHMEQAANTRKNVLYQYRGEVIHQRALARKLGVSHRTIARNYKHLQVE